MFNRSIPLGYIGQSVPVGDVGAGSGFLGQEITILGATPTPAASKSTAQSVIDMAKRPIIPSTWSEVNWPLVGFLTIGLPLSGWFIKKKLNEWYDSSKKKGTPKK